MESYSTTNGIVIDGEIDGIIREISQYWNTS